MIVQELLIVQEGGKQPELIIVQYKHRRYAFKINNCTRLTLMEEKSATRGQN